MVLDWETRKHSLRTANIAPAYERKSFYQLTFHLPEFRKRICAIQEQRIGTPQNLVKHP